MKVVFTAAAEGDLESIGDWIAQDSPARAVSFVAELREVCKFIAIAPLAHPLLRRFEKAGIRRKPHGDYVILYRVAKGLTQVIHVVHGARDYEQLLTDEFG